MLPDDTDSQDAEGTGGEQPKETDCDPNPRVTDTAAEMRDYGSSKASSNAGSDSVSQALSEGLSQGLQKVGEQLSQAMGIVEKSSRRGSARGSALIVLQAPANGKLSVKEVTAWLRALQQKRSAVEGLSVYIDALVDNPSSFKEDGDVIGKLDADDDCHLYHDVRGSIASRRVFQKYGKSEGVLASIYTAAQCIFRSSKEEPRGHGITHC